jgi:hypothetical protein
MACSKNIFSFFRFANVLENKSNLIFQLRNVVFGNFSTKKSVRLVLVVFMSVPSCFPGASAPNSSSTWGGGGGGVWQSFKAVSLRSLFGNPDSDQWWVKL